MGCFVIKWSKRSPCRTMICSSPDLKIYSSTTLTPRRWEIISQGPSWFPLIHTTSILSDILRRTDKTFQWFLCNLVKFHESKTSPFKINWCVDIFPDLTCSKNSMIALAWHTKLPRCRSEIMTASYMMYLDRLMESIVRI